MNTKAPPEPTGGALFQLNTSSPTATPPSSTDATGNNLPLPARVLIGDFTDEPRVLAALGLSTSKDS